MERKILQQLIKEHNEGKCNCDLTEGGTGLCLVGSYLEGCITIDDLIRDLDIEIDDIEKFRCSNCKDFLLCDKNWDLCDNSQTIKNNTIYNIDGIELLEYIYEEYGEKSVDMFLCDLPYTYKGKQRITANSWDTPIDLKKFFELTSILLKPNGVIALTATNPFSAKLISTLWEMENDEKFKKIDLVKYKYEWIWEKDNGSNFVHVKHQPFRVHEQVLVFGKSATTYNKKGEYMCYNPQFTYSTPYIMKRDMSDVDNLEGFKGRTDTNNKDGKRYPRSVQKFNLERGLHPTQKPVDLFSCLIKTHCPQNGLVVDICCGSGTTAIASIKTNRKFIVNDSEYKYYIITKERIVNTYKESNKEVC